jgi:hypothetical protein
MIAPGVGAVLNDSSNAIVFRMFRTGADTTYAMHCGSEPYAAFGVLEGNASAIAVTTQATSPAYRSSEPIMATPYQSGFNAAERTVSVSPGPRDGSDGSEDRAALDELAETIAELSRVTRARLARAGEVVHESAAAYPWTTVALAGLAGLVLAMALPRRESNKGHQLTRIAGYDIPPAYRISLPKVHASGLEPLTARLERVVDSISRIDPSTVSLPALQSARDWLTNLFSSARSRSVTGS